MLLQITIRKNCIPRILAVDYKFLIENFLYV